MQNDSIKKTVLVALGVCLICSVLVSSAAVALSALQKENKRLDLVKNILIAGGLYDASVNVQKVYEERVVPLMIELATGRILSQNEYPSGLNISTFDLKKVASDPQYGVRVPSEENIANIRSKPKYTVVYKIVDASGNLEKVVLPIYGYGLWSTLYGFIALDGNLKTVQGITYYEHGETPGLGGEVDNPRWKGLWKDKPIFDEDGAIALTVIKGSVDPNHPRAKYQVDGLSGATITTRGVDNMVHYWLGKNGYGPLLNALKQGGARG